MSMDKRLAQMIVLMTNARQINRTALNKLLFFADAAAVIKRGTKISQTDYVKMDFGPVPQSIDETRGWLISAGLVQETTGYAGSYVQHLYQARLNAEQIRQIEAQLPDHVQIIMNVGNHLSSIPAADLSHFSHHFEPWRSAGWYQILNFDLCKNDQNLINFLRKKSII